MKGLGGNRCLGCLHLVAALSLCTGGVHAQAHSAPDVYLVTIDTLRADHVHCYGDNDIQTPTLDALASDGIRFAEAFTPSPITNTAHTSILTGLLPSIHGVTDFGIPLAKTIPTWAELLKQHGYETAAFIGAIVLDTRTLAPGLDRGFDYYDNFPTPSVAHRHWGFLERRGIDVVRRADTWMSAHPGRPRFVWVHLYDPHDPYQPPPPFAQTYKQHLYDGEIAYADYALGHLLQYLKRTHRYQNALIIVVGDHGEGLGEHGEQTHGIFLYDATTHVPLIFKLPMAAQQSVVVKAQVQTTNILPTVLDVLHIAAPALLADRSLLPNLVEGEGSERIVVGETDYPLRFGWAPLRAVRSAGFKFIEAPQPELYKLSEDPGELRNRYEPWNKEVQQLRTELAASGMRAPGAAIVAGKAAKQTLDELRALGYLGPGDAQSSTDVPELSSLPDPKDKIEQQNLLHGAMMLADEGHVKEAQLLIEKLLRIEADFPAALRQAGELAFRSGEYRAAAIYFGRLKKTHPGDAAAALDEAKALSRVGDTRGARTALEAAVTQSPASIEARLLLAELDSRAGDRAAADDEFEAVLLLQPRQHDALVGLARDQMAEKRFSGVVDLLQPVVSDGASRDLVQLLAEAYVRLGRTHDAARLQSRFRTESAPVR